VGTKARAKEGRTWPLPPHWKSMYPRGRSFGAQAVLPVLVHPSRLDCGWDTLEREYAYHVEEDAQPRRMLLAAGALRRLKRNSRTITKRADNSDIGAEANGSSTKQLTEATCGKLRFSTVRHPELAEARLLSSLRSGFLCSLALGKFVRGRANR
jgi:hypothetical protein